MNRLIYSIFLYFITFSSPTVFAKVIEFYDQQSFLSDTGSQHHLIDFEESTPSSLIHSGDIFHGIQFDYDFGGTNMMLTDNYAGSSGMMSLGTDSGGVFQDLTDAFSLRFDATNAFGMAFILSDMPIDNEIVLSTTYGSVSLKADALGRTLEDGGFLFYLGLYDNSNLFDRVDISFLNDGETNFYFNIDDIAIAEIPAPSSPLAMLIFGAGAGVMLRLRCPQRFRRFH